MIEWAKENLEDVCIKVTDGTHDSPKSVISGGYPLIKGKDISSGFIDFVNCEFISESDHLDVISRSKPEYKDTLFTNIGNSIGDCVYINSTREFSIKNIALFKPNKDVVHPKFLFYTVISDQFKGEIWGKISGSAQPFASLSLLRSHKINLPPLPAQQKIAKILSNYDDLIENNLKRIKLLEESARLTYEEWFLRFRVDGKKLDIDAATNLPFGWEYSGLNNISTFTNGYAFKSKDFVEYGHPVIKIKNIDGKMVDVHNTNRISANDVLKVNDKFKLHEGDLLIAMTGATVGKLGFVPYSNDACYLNQRVGKIQSEYLFFTFLALSGTSGQKQILNFAGGAAQPNISGDQILAVKNIIPAKDILDKFELLSNNALSQILNFTRKNQLLKEARDILLPRLMTGMIDTDDMDIAV